MWGHITTEASYQFNFNLGFSTTRSDVLAHLAQWQYWWWFWFAFVWTFYYLISVKVIRHRSIKMKPKISTSYRPHGKWGDFLACIIPTIWVINILTNSNFILRLIEWQNESSLFTIRVRARQWYWVYKFELKNFTDILTAPKNIGHNRWVVSSFGDLQVADDYLHIIQLRSQNNWVKKYWAENLKQLGKVKKAHIISPQEQLKLDLTNNYDNININYNKLNINSNLNLVNSTNSYLVNNLNQKYYFNSLLLNNKNTWTSQDTLELEFNLFNSNSVNLTKTIFNSNYKEINLNVLNINKHLNMFNSSNSVINRYVDYIDSSRWLKKSSGTHQSIRLIKYPLNNINEVNYDLLRFRFSNGLNKSQEKILPHVNYLVVKQKRYARKKAIKPITKKVSTYINNNKQIKNYKTKPFLLDNKIIVDNQYDSNVQYKLIKKNKKRNDLIPVTLARRILRTKRTLVLPAHVNITVVTNSYDIVHSWFIPGLGLKLDCVPGRATHHTFYIDSVGFYYGQCAEICGRYHHHMPIRVCALPFEHFLVWWNTFGLPRFMFTSSKKNMSNYYSFRKYVW